MPIGGVANCKLLINTSATTVHPDTPIVIVSMIMVDIVLAEDDNVNQDKVE
jgi:hypothetical protein